MPTSARLVVIVDPGDPAAGQMRDEAAQGGHTVEAWLAPRDADELVEIAERDGDVEVMFPSFGAFLETLWSGRVPAPLWRRVRVRCGVRAGNGSDDLVRQALEAWEAFTSAAARRSRVAALILSGIAIASAAVLLWLG